MDISVSINSKSDDEYRIILSPFNLDILSNKITNMINMPIEVKADRHIHLISRDIHFNYVNAIKNAIMEMESK